MDGVTVIDHPLVQHKLTIMRRKETSTGSFRRLLREISTLLCYEVTRDLELTMETIETPLQTMESPILEGKKLVFASILRAGGLSEFVAQGLDDYIALAVWLATSSSSPAYLQDLRQTMRYRLLNSPVCDTPSLTRDMERLYTRM